MANSATPIGKLMFYDTTTTPVTVLDLINYVQMNIQKKHLSREFRTMARMVGIYCSAHHEVDQLCNDCARFLDYAEVRLEKCPYGEDKPTCANCPIHCYRPEFRERARIIMRYAGPRMLLRHPILAIAHKLDGFRRARHPRELTREERMKRNRR